MLIDIKRLFTFEEAAQMRARLQQAAWQDIPSVHSAIDRCVSQSAAQVGTRLRYTWKCCSGARS